MENVLYERIQKCTKEYFLVKIIMKIFYTLFDIIWGRKLLHSNMPKACILWYNAVLCVQRRKLKCWFTSCRVINIKKNLSGCKFSNKL